MWEVLLNENLKKNPKIPALDIIGGRFKA